MTKLIPRPAIAILCLLVHMPLLLVAPSALQCAALSITRQRPDARQRGPQVSALRARPFLVRIRAGSHSASPPPPPERLQSSVAKGYRARVAADPSFLSKSIVEVALAAGTQLAAEMKRRGRQGCIIEIDFVVAGLLTAIVGKYYSAWRVAPTARPDGEGDGEGPGIATDASASVSEMTPSGKGSFWSNIPTNAFQPFHLDGVTRPSAVERLAAIVAPVPALFRAGVIASSIGYGLTSVLIFLRTVMVPSYVAKTVSVNILHACLYTGAFMAVASNLRYQVLSGIIEPRFVDTMLRQWPKMRALVTFAIRLANGLLGSTLAIAGMKWLGLQKLKS